MNKQFIPPELQETFAGTEPPLPSAWIVQSIGNGRYAVTLCPMASRSPWTSTATSSAETPQAEGWLIHPSASHT